MPGKTWTKPKLVAAIKRLYREGADLSPTAVQKSNSALFSSARSRSHFGSWGAAIEAAGLNYDDFKRIKQRWTRDDILDSLRQLNQEGEDLLDPEFKTRYRSLYLAACAHRYFGSWQRAIKAAGLDHDKMRESRVWTKSRILRTIEQLAHEGKPLGWAYIEQHKPGIYRAARRKENFGSWAGALRAAGVEQQRIARPAPLITHAAPALRMAGADADAPAIETAEDAEAEQFAVASEVKAVF